MENSKPIICIAGATASGKSGLALQLAEAFGGEIINADSMQVYDALPILTARPTAADESHTPHHLYGHIAVGENYNVAMWREQAAQIIAEVQGRGAVPIVVGGTGLYFHALLHGLSELPDIDEEIRDALRARLASEGAAALHAELANCDPELARRLNPNDGQRIVRGLEVFATTDTPLSQLQNQNENTPATKENFIKILLAPDRDWLYQQCDARFAAMLAGGAREEVAAFAAASPPADAPLRKALGVSELLMLQADLCDEETARLTAQQRTRRYAKRQMTWFRNRMGDWQAFPYANKQEFIQNRDKIFSFISKYGLTTQ